VTVLQRLSAWLDVRPNEVRNVTLAFWGAFLVMSFAILARAMREALYLTAYDVKTLPYIIAAVAVISVPTVGLFARLLLRYSPRKVVMAVQIALSAGLALIWPFLGRSNVPGAEVVAFYLLTALGTLLLTSGFWVVISEYFAVRGAKRLFGLIGAGGTAGTMVTGNSLVWLTRRLDLPWLVILLIAIIGLFFIAQSLLPPLTGAGHEGDDKARTSIPESLKLTWDTPHLRTLAAIVFAVAIATTLLDYQFKEFAQNSFTTQEGMASFFGAFYGWVGGVSLVIQLLLVSRFLALAGIAWTLAVLPAVLLTGSVGMLVAPSLFLITAVRGADAALRKSLYRSALEVVYVPIPSIVRRKTKTFIDSVVDSVGEGLGAGIVFGVVTLLGLHSRFLSLFIIAFSLALVYLSRRMGSQYFATVTEQLQESGTRVQAKDSGARLESRDLLSGTFTRIDVRSLVREGALTQETEADQAPVSAERPMAADAIKATLMSGDLKALNQVLDIGTDWQEEHVAPLTRLLARDQLVDRTIVSLLDAGEIAVPHLAKLLRSEHTDFVIRRRIPRVLGRMGGEEADDALIDALAANRFEVRYRAAIAIVRRRRHDMPRSPRWSDAVIWEAVRAEIGRGRAVWEMQKLLDAAEKDELVAERVGVRGELSLEHTFRLLSLVMEPEVARAAFNGVMLDDENLKSFSLEYLEQALPADVRKRLWPFIGDVSEYQREKSLRPLDDVVSDLMKTGATLFGDATHREALKDLLEDKGDKD
jgi:ATP/ADP translocase